MSTSLNEEGFAGLLRPGHRVFVAGAAGHSLLFERWLTASPRLARDVTFCGALVPGVNSFDFAGLDDQAQLITFLLSPALRASWQAGRVRHLPMDYPSIVNYMAAQSFDLALLQVAPPDSHGNCSFGVAADFGPLVWQGARKIVAHVNPGMPRTAGPTIPFARIDHVVEHDMPLLEVDAGMADASTRALAARVAPLIIDGSTLQLGLGRLQHALLPLLGDRRRLRIHSGMVADGLLQLRDAGALAECSKDQPPVRTGVALGSRLLYAAVADPTLAHFHDASYTHAADTLSRLDGLVSVNSAIEVDLLGQVNAEMIDGVQVSGAGGLANFARGARAASNGRSVIALTSTAGRKAVSRIVPRLAAGTPVALSRADIDTVVTEHGCAELKNMDVDARARALIAIAAPEHRDALSQSWLQLRKLL